MNVVVYMDPPNGRSVIVCEAMAKGIHRIGDRVRLRRAEEYAGPEGDVAVFYGLRDPMRRVRNEHKREGKSTVQIDLGYWHRKRYPGDVQGYHKVSVGGSQAMHLLHADVSSDRFESFGIEPRSFQPIDDSKSVLLIGLSKKAAWAYDLEFERWEREKCHALHDYTTRSIIYRPKPGADGYADRSLADAYSSPAKTPVERALTDTHMAVMRHSNVAIDALIAGVPFYTEDGLASGWSTPIEEVECPRFPTDRERQKILNRVAYAQWNVQEMEEGKVWEFLREGGYV